jgi:hypothetical protein
MISPVESDVSTDFEQLVPMQCRYSRVEWDMPARDHWWKPRKYLPRTPRDGSLKALWSAEGRPLCPIKKRT